MRLSPTALWRTLTRGTRRLFGSDRAFDRDLHDEMQHYIEQATSAAVAEGVPVEVARRDAQRAFGNATSAREGVRMSLWEHTVSTFAADVRFALRMLRRTPVFTAVIVLVIALGTGAVTTIFSAANAILLRPVPGTVDPEQLVQVDRISADGSEGAQASYPLYTQLRDNNHTLDGLAAWSKASLTISLPSGGVSSYGNIVSANYFAVLGVRPALGRFFLPDEDRAPLGNAVIVVSYDFWNANLHADSAAIGRTVGVNGHPYTLIGVAPKGFHGVFTPILAAAWIPLSMQQWVRSNRDLDNPGVTWLWEFARIKPGVPEGAVRQDLKTIMLQHATRVEPTWLRRYSELRLIPLTGLPDDAHKAMLAFLGLLLAASVLVLVIASVNVGAMLSARAVARKREMALRVALGARGGRIIRQLLTETLVLFVVGGAFGALIAVGATAALERIPLPVSEPLTLELSPDARVFAFALAISVAMGIAFGLAPALRSARADVRSAPHDDGAGSGSRRSIVSSGLIVGQLALSLVLLVAAGLLLRAFDRGQRVDPGFTIAGVLTASIDTDAWGYDDTKSEAYMQRLAERIAAMPGVAAVSFAQMIPLTLSNTSGAVNTAAPNAPGNVRVSNVAYNIVDVGYFDALQLRVVGGRAFARTDDAAGVRVAIVNETLARKLASDGNALGRTFTLLDSNRVTVIGIARDAKYAAPNETTPPFAYFPMLQAWQLHQNLLVRVNGDERAVRNAISMASREIDPALPPLLVGSLEDATSVSLLPQRVAAMVAGALGLLGLVLATVGLYGIISYSVSRRRREIGIRMALGARQIDVQRLVVREGMRLASLGVAIGLALAAGAAQLIRSYLYGVSTLDAVTFLGMPAALGAVALVASYLPARRAARAEPMLALRVG